MNKIIRSILVALAFIASPALAQQSTPNWTFGYVPTPAEWNTWFGKKVDWQGAAPCAVSGCTFSGALITVAPSTSAAGFNLPPGNAPTTPNNGDVWSTTNGVYARIAGVTLGPMGSATVSVNPDFSVANSAALTPVTGLTFNVAAGNIYAFEAILYCTDAAAGGVQASIGGSATATSVIYEGYTLDANTVKGQVQAAALGTAVGSTTTTGTTPSIRINGTITVATAGTLLVNFAQNTSNATASVVKRGSFFRITPTN